MTSEPTDPGPADMMLAAVAHAGGISPAPTELQLTDWLPECPASALAEASGRLDALTSVKTEEEAGWQWSRYVALPGAPAMRCPANGRNISHGALIATNPKIAGAVMTAPVIHAEWLAARTTSNPEQRMRHPLAPILKAWSLRPIPVKPEHRQDKRILPTIKVSEYPERETGRLFGGLHESRQVAKSTLALWPDMPTPKRVPLLDLVDIAGVPVMLRGRGAPIEQRLFVRTLATVRPEDRKRLTVRIALTLRELRNGLFPNGWNRTLQWPHLRHALTTARNYGVHDGRGVWFPLALRYMPDDPGLDDLIVMDVAFPKGSATGPEVRLPEMDALSVTSGPRWRAYIAGHSLSWKPGQTRVRNPSSGRFGWSQDASRYPVATLADLRRLAFGAGDRKHRTRSDIENAWRNLPGLDLFEQAVNARTGEVGWRIVPTGARVPKPQKQ